MSGTITSPGVGSGVNINSIVSKLVKADFGAQQTQIQNHEGNLKSELSVYGKINSDISSIKTALDGLANLNQGFSANSSNTSVLNAATTSGASGGTYNVNVSQLAKAETLASSSFASSSGAIGTGTLTFQFGNYSSGGVFTAASGSSSDQISISSTNDSLNGIANAINKANFGVSATVVSNGTGYQLALTSKTGTQNELKITTSNSALSGLTYNGSSGGLSQTSAAADASININGISITSQNNTVDNVVSGVNFTLNGTGSSVVNVSPNSSAIVGAVKSFVSAYNSYASDVNKYASYDPKSQAAGILLGSSTLRTMTSELQNGVVKNIANVPANFSNLMDLGITANANGTLNLNTSQLSQAINSDYPAVVKALQGAGQQLGTVVNGMIGTNGIITAKTNSINQQLSDLQKQLKTLGKQASQEQQTLLKQYNYMNTVVANLKNTGNYLTRMLSGNGGGSSSSSSSSSKIGG